MTSPLTPDGKSVDFLAAYEQVIYSDKIATDDNGYRLMVENLGHCMVSDQKYLEPVCRKLGMNVKALRAEMNYQDPVGFTAEWAMGPDFDAEIVRKIQLGNSSDSSTPLAKNRMYESYEALDIVTNRFSRPWTIAEIQFLKTWIEENHDAFDVVAEAVRKPVFECPLGDPEPGTGIDSIPLSEIQWMRSVARGLSVRANYRMGLGDIDGAIDDFETMKRLGIHLQNQALAITQLIGFAIEGMANSIDILGYTHAPAKREHLLRLQEIEGEVTRQNYRDDDFLFFRMQTIDLIARQSNGVNLREFGESQIKYLVNFGIDWNIVAATFNTEFTPDRDVTALQEETATLERADYTSRYRRSVKLGKFLASADRHERIGEVYHHYDCASRLRQIVLAMLLYEKDHGTLPPAFTIDTSGKKLHSWRVLLLPYLDQQKLFDQIKKDEPWDSPHNKKFASVDVPTYRCEGDLKAKAGDTHYSVVVGPGLAFTGATGTSLDSFPGNDKRLILVGERSEPTCWMDPSGEVSLSSAKLGVNPSLPTGAKIATAVLGSQHPQGVNFGFRSGAVEVLQSSVTPDDLTEMLKGEFRRVE